MKTFVLNIHSGGRPLILYGVYMEKYIFVWCLNIAWVIRSRAELLEFPSVILLMELKGNCCVERPPIILTWNM
jgi:hypothetical protein